MTSPAPVPSDPAAAWTELRTEILSWHTATAEIAGDLEDEGKDPAGARAKDRRVRRGPRLHGPPGGLLMNPPNSPEESTMSQTRDNRWDRADGLFDAAYGDFLIERGPRVVEAEDREWWGDSGSRAGKISRDARKARLIAAKRAR